MRFVIFGAGAVGGAIGGRLAARRADVVLIARGAHGGALHDRGLTIITPDGASTVRPPVVAHPRDLAWTGDEVVILAVKSQDTVAALDALAASAPPTVDVVCAQNGIENERAALRRFARVIALYPWLPAEHIEPGVVRLYCAPASGVLDIGRYPRGADPRAGALAAVLADATFESVARPDIMRWKHHKLLTNLANAVDAICGGASSDEALELCRMARSEGVAALTAAGLDAISDDEAAARRGDRLVVRPIAGKTRSGGSSWQSLARGTGAIETDYLNGEIVLLGRIYGVATPVNALLQRTANELARDHRAPGSISAPELLRRARAAL